VWTPSKFPTNQGKLSDYYLIHDIRITQAINSIFQDPDTEIFFVDLSGRGVDVIIRYPFCARITVPLLLCHPVTKNTTKSITYFYWQIARILASIYKEKRSEEKGVSFLSWCLMGIKFLDNIDHKKYW